MKQSGGRIRGKVGGERMEKAQNLFNFTFKKKGFFGGALLSDLYLLHGN